MTETNTAANEPIEDDHRMLPELVAHLREHRSELRAEWASRIDSTHLLQAMTPQEIGSETTSVYDNYVEVLETGSVDGASGTPVTCPSGSFPAASRPTRSSASCCSSVTCWPARCSRSTAMTSTCSTACSTPTNRLPTASPTQWR